MSHVSAQTMEIWQTFVFCKFVHFQGVFYFLTQVAFCFHDSYNFCSRLTSAISLHAQVQKYPLFDSQSDREFTFSYAILGQMALLLGRLSCCPCHNDPKGNRLLEYSGSVTAKQSNWKQRIGRTSVQQ